MWVLKFSSSVVRDKIKFNMCVLLFSELFFGLGEAIIVYSSSSSSSPLEPPLPGGHFLNKSGGIRIITFS